MQRPFRHEYTEIRPASLGKRLLAILYDSLILLAIWLAVAIVATALNQGGVTSPLGRAAEQSAVFCFSFLFYGYFWTHNGQTLGMQAWRLPGTDSGWPASQLDPGPDPLPRRHHLLGSPGSGLSLDAVQ